MFKTATLKWFMAAVVIGAAPILSSCSDDDDDNPNAGTGDKVSVSTVFPKGVYKPAGVTGVTMGSDGLVQKLTTEDGETITFEYIGVTSRANEPRVKMTVKDEYDEMYMLMTLNSAGYVKYCLESYPGESETDEWWFEYNADGQLNYMKRSEGGNEVTRIQYAGGDITSVKMTSEEDDNSMSAVISYTTTENIGGVMYFDDCFAIDMDEMKWAYFAGLLGKATKHLPSKLVEDDGDITTFSWELNDAGLPTNFSSTYEGYTYTEPINW